MVEHQQFDILKDLALIVFTATVAIRVFAFLKLPYLLGFIVVGVFLCPITGLVEDTAGISATGELGVMFMMFFIGLEFNLSRLNKVLFPSAFALLFQVVGMVVFGLILARFMGLDATNGFLMGAALAMSSTIVIIELLSERKQLNKHFAHITVGILIAEDLFAIFLLVIISSLAGEGQTDAYALTQKTLMMMTFVVSVFIIGKLIVPKIIKRYFSTYNQQELIMLTFCVILGVGFFANIAEMSLALGAFLAGSIFSGTVVSTKIEKLTTPFRNLFVALFFVSIGTMIDPMEIVKHWQIIVIVTLAIFFLRPLFCYFGVVFSGTKPSDAFKTALNKAQVGEFSFVVAGLGVSSGIMDSSIIAISMGVSFLTVTINPLISAKSNILLEKSENFVPKKVKIGFDVYYNYVESLRKSFKKSVLALLLPPFSRFCIYALLFNAILIVATNAGDLFANNYIQPRIINISIWLLASVLSFPVLWGLFHNLKTCSKVIVISIFGNKLSSEEKSKAHKILHIIFSVSTILLFAVIYLSFVGNYLSLGATGILFIGSCIFFAIVIKKNFSNIGVGLESEFKSVFQRHIENAHEHQHSIMLDNIRKNYEWALDISEVEIPDLAKCTGKRIADLAIRKNTGAEIVAIRRGRFVSYNIMPDTKIFPDDIVILTGTTKEIQNAHHILTEEESDIDKSSFNKETNYVYSNSAVIEPESELIGKTLSEANLTKLWGIKILAILRDGQKTHIKPSATEVFQPNDTLLVMGMSENLARVESALNLSFLNH